MSEKKNEFFVKGEDLIKKVKELVREGNIRKIIIKNTKDEVFLEIPLSVGAVAAILAPVWAALGAIAAVTADFKIEIVKREQEPKDVGPAEE